MNETLISIDEINNLPLSSSPAFDEEIGKILVLMNNSILSLYALKSLPKKNEEDTYIDKYDDYLSEAEEDCKKAETMALKLKYTDVNIDWIDECKKYLSIFLKQKEEMDTFNLRNREWDLLSRLMCVYDIVNQKVTVAQSFID